MVLYSALVSTVICVLVCGLAVDAAVIVVDSTLDDGGTVWFAAAGGDVMLLYVYW